MKENINEVLLENIETSTGIFYENSIVVNADSFDNAVLKRLISEVQSEKRNDINAYNRTHNRHNRGR
jgi:hypothetical protein